MLSHEDEVDGHHAVSVGQMDEEKLFYLQSRGLSAAEARRMMVTAILEPVLDRFSEELRQEAAEELERRLSHE
jgi:Fe-S cluster assembly scaffold protein SufB